MTFEDWLLKQKNKDHPIGDLASDWISEGAPRPFTRKHLKELGVDQMVLDAYTSARRAYNRANSKRSTPGK